MSEGLDPARAAEVLVALPAGRPGRRGSGYRVGERGVLTAAHVVRGGAGTTVSVRFDADRGTEWTASARVLLAADSADVALLELAGPLRPGPAVEPPSYGLVPDADLVLPCSAMGFPRFKLREDRMRFLDDGSPAQYRDSCHATGTISVLSNRREGTLELAVGAPGADPDPDRSPWAGMSGAAVWHGGTLIGLVSSHHRSDGLGRLSATRTDRWHALLTAAELDLLHRHAGLPAPAGLVAPAAPATGSATAPISLSLPDTLPLRELDGLVSALTALPSVRSATGLALLLDGISPEIAVHSPRAPALRVDVFGIVRTCLRYPGTLDQLLEAIRITEGDSEGVRRMNQEAAELARRHPDRK
ncbi:trypsin-like peptidase domain-containing protein [Streptomyces sp. NPDC006733]|uniref:effector-associated domain 2-containing protein n=1 Tax=Streptomyces sp. NPDC006733 TaxID=3155460 RepID=UPI00340272C2